MFQAWEASSSPLVKLEDMDECTVTEARQMEVASELRVAFT